MVVKMQDVLGAIAVKKGLSFTKFLNYELNKLRGSGVLQNVLAIPKQSCPLDENPMPIAFSKTVFLFTVFVLGGILSLIIFIVERAVSNKNDGTLTKVDEKQCNTIKGRISKPDKIKIQCNDIQSVAIRKEGRPFEKCLKKKIQLQALLL
jgi:hypothetical protein